MGYGFQGAFNHLVSLKRVFVGDRSLPSGFAFLFGAACLQSVLKYSTAEKIAYHDTLICSFKISMKKS